MYQVKVFFRNLLRYYSKPRGGEGLYILSVTDQTLSMCSYSGVGALLK